MNAGYSCIRSISRLKLQADERIRTIPYFTVIIPTYNRARLLRAAIDSVLAQTFRDYELIVVVDGSTDETPHVLKDYREHVRIIHQANAGPGYARNHGAREARGRYLVFLDNDDVWFPWTLQSYAYVLESQADARIILPTMFTFQEERALADVTNRPLKWTRYDHYLALTELLPLAASLAGGTCAMRKDTFDQVGGYSDQPRFVEDLNLYLKLATTGPLVVVDSPELYGRRKHDDQLTADRRRFTESLALIIAAEKKGQYAGGAKWRKMRRRLIAFHIRTEIYRCLKARQYRPAWRLYRATLGWQIRLQRWRFLLGFWILWVRNLFYQPISLKYYTSS